MKIAEETDVETSVDMLPSLSTIIEAILFAVDRPVTTDELRRAVPEADKESILAALEILEQKYEQNESGVGLQEVAGGYLLSTRPELGSYVERFLVGKRRARLSRAALETIATIAYRQPITRGEVEELRGVDSGHVIHTLMSRDLITVKGRSEMLGRPLLYATTTEFMRYFGLQSISDLPNLDEMAALTTSDPLEDPEIREALETSGLLEDLHDTELTDSLEGASEEIHDTQVEADGKAGPAEEADADDPSEANEVSCEQDDVLANGNGSNGHEANGNGNGSNGQETNGNGNGSNGHKTNGNGNGSNGHKTNADSQLRKQEPASFAPDGRESPGPEIVAGGEIPGDEATVDEATVAEEELPENETSR